MAPDPYSDSLAYQISYVFPKKNYNKVALFDTIEILENQEKEQEDTMIENEHNNINNGKRKTIIERRSSGTSDAHDEGLNNLINRFE